jgi:multiple sugar transport system permease protein
MTQDYIRQRERRIGWYLTIPAVLVLLLVYAYPILRAFVLSLFTENLSTNLEPVFSGLENYSRMAQDGRFWLSIGNTAIFTVCSLVMELLLGMGIALTLDQSFRGRGWVRTIAILALGVADGLDCPGLALDFQRRVWRLERHADAVADHR